MAKKSAAKPELTGAAEREAGGEGRPAAAIDALLELAAETEWDEIELATVAERAGPTLSRNCAASSLERRHPGRVFPPIDEIVLAGIDEGMAGEPARERLFDTLMRRSTRWRLYRSAVACCPFLRPGPLDAGGMEPRGRRLDAMDAGGGLDRQRRAAGCVRAQGLAIAWARILRSGWRTTTRGSRAP